VEFYSVQGYIRTARYGLIAQAICDGGQHFSLARRQQLLKASLGEHIKATRSIFGRTHDEPCSYRAKRCVDLRRARVARQQPCLIVAGPAKPDDRHAVGSVSLALGEGHVGELRRGHDLVPCVRNDLAWTGAAAGIVRQNSNA
jgi:hypothetical protein